ncbi:hypothetical protein D3C80_1543260 [compost metagenome]
MASLGGQPRHLFTVLVHAKSDALGGVVGAEQGLAPLVTKFIGTEAVGALSREHSTPLLAVVTHLRDAEGADRHPKVGQQAPQPAGAQVASLE